MTPLHADYLIALANRGQVMAGIAALATLVAAAVIGAGRGPWWSIYTRIRRMATALATRAADCSACWIVVFLVALVARLVAIGAESPSYDEAFTWWLARAPWDQFWPALAGDVHPPAWYLVERLTVATIGDSIVAIRLPAAVFGATAVALVYTIARHYLAPGAALVAGLVAAVQPGILYYSQDARMYPLLATMILVMYHAALTRRWTRYAAAGALATYAHNLAPVLVAPIGLVAIAAAYTRAQRITPAPGPARAIALAWQHQQTRRAILANAAIVLAWSPWAVFSISQARTMDSGFWLTLHNAGDLLWPVAVLVTGTRAPDPVLVASLVAALVATILASVEAWRALSTSRPGLLLATGLAGGPAALLIVSLLWRPMYLARALTLSGHLWPILVAIGSTYTPRPARRRAIAVLAAVAVVPGLIYHYTPAQGARTDASAITGHIADHWQTGDLIIHHESSTAIAARPDLPDLDYCVLTPGAALTEGLTVATVQALGIAMCESDQLNQARRIWYIWQISPTTTHERQVSAIHYLAHHEAELITAIGNDLSSVALYLVEPERTDAIQAVQLTYATARALDCPANGDHLALDPIRPFQDCLESIVSAFNRHD